MGQVIIHTLYTWPKCLYPLPMGHWTTTPQAFPKAEREGVWSKFIFADWLPCVWFLASPTFTRQCDKDLAQLGNLGVGDMYPQLKTSPILKRKKKDLLEWQELWLILNEVKNDLHHWPLTATTARRVLSPKVKKVEPGLSGFPFLSPGWDWEAFTDQIEEACLLTDWPVG